MRADPLQRTGPLGPRSAVVPRTAHTESHKAGSSIVLLVEPVKLVFRSAIVERYEPKQSRPREGVSPRDVPHGAARSVPG